MLQQQTLPDSVHDVQSKFQSKDVLRLKKKKKIFDIVKIYSSCPQLTHTCTVANNIFVLGGLSQAFPFLLFLHDQAVSILYFLTNRNKLLCILLSLQWVSKELLRACKAASRLPSPTFYPGKR